MNLQDFYCMRQGKVVAMVTPQESQWMRSFQHKTSQNNHAVLLLHGFSSSPAVYRLFYHQLTAWYDGVFAPIIPGHGESIAAFEAARAQEWTEYVSHYYQELCQNYEAVDVIGLSMGGLLALHLSQHFSIHHLYLLAPALDLHLSLPKTLILAKVLHRLGFRYLRAKAGNLYTERYCEIAYRQLPLTTVIEMLNWIHSFEWQLPACPTDVFLGTYDSVVNSALVAARFNKQAHIKLHWLANSAHVLPLDGDVDIILQCIKDNVSLR